MRTIYFSPHLDDAVLSAGGLIYEQTKAGTPVEIWTFMCGFPRDKELTDFARVLHKIWGTESAEQTVRLRREEDQRAALILGAKAVHFDFLDCIYRRGRDGQVLYTSSVYDPPHAAEADLPAQIAQTMIAWLKPDDVLVCQLGIGSHVDHVIVRQAAEMLKRRLLYDADLPYLFNNPQDFAPKTAGMKESVQPVPEANLESWHAAIHAYASQLDSLFESPELMWEKMRAYWSERNGIRLWEIA
jgi:LmbE family N-acetylglucosaminyl deacetylase